jgi:hypothetical protein
MELAKIRSSPGCGQGDGAAFWLYIAWKAPPMIAEKRGKKRVPFTMKMSLNEGKSPFLSELLHTHLRQSAIRLLAGTKTAV